MSCVPRVLARSRCRNCAGQVGSGVRPIAPRRTDLGRFHGVLFLNAPLRVTIEHEAPIALGDKLDIIAHVHPPGSTDNFGPGLVDRTITTLTYTVGDGTKAIASIFALYPNPK
jgi:hypothetical protein